MHPEPDIRHAPIDLWRIMRMFIAQYFQLFGEPHHIAQQEVLTKKAYDLALTWLRAGEAFLRHLLLIEAANYPALAPASPRAPSKRQRRLVLFHPDKPDEWRVSFRCTARMERRRPRRHVPAPALDTRFHQAWPLALRVEAMLRVFNNPGAYAKRLAGKLRAKPALIRQLTHIPPNADNLVGYDAFEKAEPLTQSAQKHFDPG